MERSNRLRVGDIRAVFRLVGEVAELRARPAEQRACLCGGLARLFHAHMSSVLHFENFTPTGRVGVLRQDLGGVVRPELQDVMAYFASQFGGTDLRKDPAIDYFSRLDGLDRRPLAHTRRSLMPKEEWFESDAYREVASVVGIDDMLAGSFPLGPHGELFGMTAQRLEVDPYFSSRETAMFTLLNEELWHLYQAGKLDGASSKGPALTPRQTQVMLRLLHGESPKQIAYELELSISTVRTYIRDLYKRLGVSGREEMMARHI